jgi:hypothetical protein
MSTMVDYGYGDAVPDSTNYEYGENAPDYGYGDAQPDYGYGDGAPSNSSNSVDYGYGDAQNEYGYGDASPSINRDTSCNDVQPDYGYGDGSPEEGSSDEPKRRPRRRNSVTRYSIVCQDAVKNEFDAHANVIDQFRNGSMDAPAVSAPIEGIALDSFPGENIHTKGSYSDDGRSHEDSSGSVDGEQDGKDMSKKKKRGWGFRLGRSASSD